VTSHSAQGQTADRVLVHIDLDRAGEALVNQRLAYVALSRGRDDAQIYTNDKSRLAPPHHPRRPSNLPFQHELSVHEAGFSRVKSLVAMTAGPAT
jgi:hypothetical protein